MGGVVCTAYLGVCSAFWFSVPKPPRGRIQIDIYKKVFLNCYCYYIGRGERMTMIESLKSLLSLFTSSYLCTRIYLLKKNMYFKMSESDIY